MSTHIITIDGPSGSGKGTLATMLAEHYGYHLLDSGAIYRLLGLSLYQRQLLDQLDTALEQCVEIRTEEVGAFASQVAAIPALRDALLQRQKDFAQAPGLIADGRDMATTVFPDADAKIYLTASAQSRAERRVKQLQGMGADAKIDAILANIEARDKRDMERSVAPLKPADDAKVIDSSALSIEQVFDQMCQHIDQRLAK